LSRVGDLHPRSICSDIGTCSESIAATPPANVEFRNVSTSVHRSSPLPCGLLHRADLAVERGTFSQVLVPGALIDRVQRPARRERFGWRSPRSGFGLAPPKTREFVLGCKRPGMSELSSSRRLLRLSGCGERHVAIPASNQLQRSFPAKPDNKSACATSMAVRGASVLAGRAVCIPIRTRW
jgi:hypothetical protein